MNSGSCDLTRLQERRQDLQVIGSLPNGLESGSLEPTLRGVERKLEWCGRYPDSGMGDDGQELVDAGPRDGPGAGTAAEPF